MAKKEKQHPENRGDRNPLTSRKIKQQLRQNRFVSTKKSEKSQASPRAGTEINLPVEPKPEIPAQQPARPPQPQPGDPVPLR